MGIRKPQYVANLLVEQGSSDSFSRLKDTIVHVMRIKCTDLSLEEVYDYAEHYERDIANELFKKIEDNTADGVRLTYEIKEEDGDYFVRFISDEPAIKLLRELQVDKPENFEIFCRAILEKLGGHAFSVGGSIDGGIDFTASNLKLESMPSASTKGSRIFVIGQAKRFSDGNHITETDIRRFVGACVKRIDEYKKTRAEQYGIFQPTILAYWTTSDFHSDAKKIARDFGIWYLGGTALSQLAINLGIRTIMDVPDRV